MQALGKETSIKERRQMLGTRDECILLPSNVEINQKHMKVHKAFSRYRDVAARHSDSK